jgi:hypothetical protein
VPTVQIRRSTLASTNAGRLIAANTELTATFPKTGANHFSLSEAQVMARNPPGQLRQVGITRPSAFRLSRKE